MRDWEPRHALTPGPSGLEAHRAIVEGLPRVLAPGGRVLLEIGPTQGPAVEALLAAAGLRARDLHRDLDGRDRAVEASLTRRSLSACHFRGGAYMVLLIPPHRSISSTRRAARVRYVH